MRSILELRSGARLSQFKIQRRLARTSMSAVYDAFDRTNGKPVIIKTAPKINPSGIKAPFLLIQCLRNEKDILAKNIDPIFPEFIAYGAHGDGEYIAMEKINGPTLHALMLSLRQEGREVTIPRMIEIVMQVCIGLKSLHTVGFVHRDIKLQHIFVQDADGMARLIDLGIACRIGHRDPGVMLGTTRFMSPEQLHNKPIDQRADIYALGLVFNMLITGRGVWLGSNDTTKPAFGMPYNPRPVDPVLIGAKLGFGRDEVSSLMSGNRRGGSLKRRITDLTKLINEIVAKMSAENMDDRLANINEAVPMLKRAKKLAESLP